MKNPKREIIKKIIGPEAKKRGFEYSCSGRMPMTTPLAMYSKTDDNLTLTIYFFQYNYNPDVVIVRFDGMEKELKCKTDEEVTRKIEEFLHYLLEKGFDDLDASLVDPLRVKIADQEEFRDRFEELYKTFEQKFGVHETADTLELFKIIDKVYPQSDNLEGPELREFLFETAAEFGRAMLKFPDGFCEWKYNAYLFCRKDYSAPRRSQNVLRYMFVVKKNGEHTDLEENYPSFMTYQERLAAGIELPRI